MLRASGQDWQHRPETIDSAVSMLVTYGYRQRLLHTFVDYVRVMCAT